jgi:hypothetical protein
MMTGRPSERGVVSSSWSIDTLSAVRVRERENAREEIVSDRNLKTFVLDSSKTLHHLRS